MQFVHSVGNRLIVIEYFFASTSSYPPLLWSRITPFLTANLQAESQTSSLIYKITARPIRQLPNLFSLACHRYIVPNQILSIYLRCNIYDGNEDHLIKYYILKTVDWKTEPVFLIACKHGRHIAIITPLAASHFCFPINHFEGMHHFHSKFTTG